MSRKNLIKAVDRLEKKLHPERVGHRMNCGGKTFTVYYSQTDQSIRAVDEDGNEKAYNSILKLFEENGSLFLAINTAIYSLYMQMIC